MLWRTLLTATPLMLLAHTGSALGQTAAPAEKPVTPVAQKASFASKLFGKKAKAAVRPGTTLTWLGHASWLLKSPEGTQVLIDPWLENPRKPADFKLPEHLDAIVVTHGHADHVGDAQALAEKYHVPVIASFELIEQLGLKDGIGANPGGVVTIKDLHMHLTQAVHSSSIAMPGHLPPPPAETAAPSKGAPCHCPPEHHCHKHGTAEGEGAHEHGAEEHAHKHDHAHHHGKGMHAHEAEEVVVGPAERAVKAAAALAAARANAAGTQGKEGAQEAKPAGCHCPGHDHGDSQANEPGEHPQRPHLAYAGSAMGVVIHVGHGPTIYHAGDTDLFLDMGLIKRRYSPEVALLPIGGHYTMGPKDAALAAGLLGVKDVVPMHYGTNPLLSGTPKELFGALDEEHRMIAPGPGAQISYAYRP